MSSLNRDVFFYGIVKDQHGNPVSDVDVEMSVGAYNSFSLGTNRSVYHEKTDINGFFKLSPRNGNGVSITLRKNGYYIGYAGYSYGGILDRNMMVPKLSENSPEIILLWEKSPPQTVYQLRRIDKKGSSEGNWRSNYCIDVDLTENSSEKLRSKVPSFLLRLTVQYIDNEYSRPLNITIESIDGGELFMADDSERTYESNRLRYEAPEKGYQKSINWNHDKITTNGCRFFFRSANGLLHGSFLLDLSNGYTYYENTGQNNWRLEIDYIKVNPSGSRNLEIPE